MRFQVILTLFFFVFFSPCLFGVTSYLDNKHLHIKDGQINYDGTVTLPRLTILPPLKLSSISVLAPSTSIVVNVPVSFNRGVTYTKQVVQAGGVGMAINGNLTVTGKLKFSPTANFNLLPANTILIWYGSSPTTATQNVPAGWALCDGRTVVVPGFGTFQTPDLRSRFIKGRNAQVFNGANIEPRYSGGAGGSDIHSHTHSVALLTFSGSSGSHSIGVSNPSGETDSNEIPAINAMNAHTHTHSVDHSHSVPDVSYSGGAGSAYPPFYTLSFIVKLP